LAVAPFGVFPRLLHLDNGVLVLASGRPCVQIRFSFDGKGEKWTDPFEMLPFDDDEFMDTYSERSVLLSNKKLRDSCGYTGLLATGPDSFLVIYSDFNYLNENNEVRKAIKVREIKVSKK